MKPIDSVARLVLPSAFGPALLALLIAGCGALPDKPQRAALYDFGPGLGTPSATTSTAMPPISLPEIDANTRLDGTQLNYRLGYADANELKPYGQSRWSVAPTQLLRQRLREALSARRTVLGPEESATIARRDGKVPDTLRISLDEFSQYFESQASSVGLVRLRATLVQSTAGGDRVLGQRSFNAQRPAPTGDAAGGVKALAAASDAAIAEMVAWVDQLPR
ncbi:ABC-type transport auxiliary lipoprotein family protein [Variovorax sp. LG9.2]|uniref:ABC-type transport auxiliary lipoprotein family protein n=1 Tax=Variovorax sp. LG9.2 TaxID=3048626 RepID=UPI002B236262|nr:ABC-type transport auxiliary lipoprotein family protein [Variovorax sp. LG9.2]MEB0057931.1 ABC-type transport auxiliary lipoprotein family protein [Variovorax sp. LG9.2]